MLAFLQQGTAYFIMPAAQQLIRCLQIHILAWMCWSCVLQVLRGWVNGWWLRSGTP